MNNITPIVSVLMPVYNCELYIEESIKSILNQTYTNFELLIFDDCSTDGTVKIINQFKDSRIKLIKKDKNTGLTVSLNMGLKLANGKYIARMDGDDVSLPNRFQKQIEVLRANKNVVLCSTLYKIYNWHMVSKQPLNHEEIKVGLLSGCCVSHPTVMMRKKVFEDYNLTYDESKESGEDYELWSRLIFLGEFCNLGEVLLEYRTHPNQISQIKNKRQLEITAEIKLKMLKKVKKDIPTYISNNDMEISNIPLSKLPNDIKIRLQLLNQLLIENKTYNKKLFDKYIKRKKELLFNNVMKSKKMDFITASIFIFNSRGFVNMMGFQNIVKILYKSILKKYR